MKRILQKGGNVKLEDDITLTSDILIVNESAINLNGHTISSTISSPLFTVDGGQLTLKGDGEINAKKVIGIAQNGGLIEVEDGTYISTQHTPFRAYVDGAVIVNGGDIEGQEGAIDALYGRATILINDGLLVGYDNFPLASNGSDGRGGNVMTLNGGKLVGNIQSAGYEAVGVYVANDDTFVMNGGEIIAYGGTAICMRAGKATINGGTITATNVNAQGQVVADGKIGDDPTVMTGCSAIIYHQTSHYPGQAGGMKLTINGGTITGVDHSVQVLSDEAEPQVFVTGGTLTPAYPEN